MSTYVISGNMYSTQEYCFTYEIEADSPQEAAEEFRRLSSSSKLPPDLEQNLEKIDRPFDHSGTFSVFSEEAFHDDDFDPDQDTLVADESFGEA